VPKCTDENYWQAIDKIVKENSIEFAVILPELEVMEWAKRNTAGLLPCKALLPEPVIAALLVDKAKMTEILNPFNMVPKSVEFAYNETDLQKVFTTLGSTFWVRSTSGTSGLGSLKIDSLASLKNWIQINPGVKQFLASTFLPGRNLACKLLYYNGKLLRAACAERVNYIMAKVAPSGITGNTSFGRLLNEPTLVETATKAMEHLFAHTKANKHGFFTVDFKEDENGNPLITEVNVRHVAFTQCFAACGANFAEDTMRLLDNDPSYNHDFIMYNFEEGSIFLRDVDALPILMKEKEFLK
jgi:carbamoyl-phosphate synthase large subunit